MPEVRSFGIEDKLFTVYVDPESLNDSGLLKRLEQATWPQYNVVRLLKWTEPLIHHRNGDLIQGENSRIGMLTTFAERVGVNGMIQQRFDSLYFVTCAHLAPEKEMRVYFFSNCECKLIDCPCEKEEMGINLYPFDRDKENRFNAVVDITCGIVNRRISNLCNTNTSCLRSRQIQMVDFSNTIESHTAKTVLKWDCDGNLRRGQYSGVQYMTNGRVPRRVDIIKNVEQNLFGVDGHCGAMIFLKGEECDSMSPAFVYLGKWADDKFMCFRLQEGIECLELEYNLKLRLCFDSLELQS